MTVLIGVRLVHGKRGWCSLFKGGETKGEVMRALIIDDSRPIRGIIAKIMRSLDFETVEAENGAQAWEILSEQGAFDVITVNWEMPEMDGVQFVSKVRRSVRFRAVPMLMISSISDEDRMMLAREKGVDEYLIKPCTLGSITKKLQALGVLAAETGNANHAGIRNQISSDGPQTGRLTGRKSIAVEKNPNGSRSRRSDSQVAKPGKLQAGPEIRVLLVEDSSIVRNVIKTTLEGVGGFSIVGNAADGIEGLEQLVSAKPDAVLLDIEMPRMDGLEMLRQMRQLGIKVPVVMFSSRTERGAKATTDALLLGAKDFVFKPGGPRMADVQAGEDVIREQIAPRLKWLCERGRRGSERSRERAVVTTSPTKKKIEMVVVAASTGGPAALATLFQDDHLRKHLNQPILVVQHMPALFTKYLASRLAEESGLDIAESVEGEVLRPGMIRIAPGGNHLLVKQIRNEYITSINRTDAVNSCRPSADVLFQSAASAVKEGVLGVMLTGMGLDGREGCRSIRGSGGSVVAQDEATSVVWGMPGSIVAAGLANHITPMNLIGKTISSYLKVGE